LNWLVAVVALVITFVVSAASVRWLSRTRGSMRVVDMPSDRSLHNRPIPRTGGLGLLLGLSVGLMIAMGMAVAEPTLPSGANWGSVLFAVVLVAVVSFVDDLYDTPPLLRLMVQMLATVVLLSGGFVVTEVRLPGLSWSLGPWVAVVLTGIYVVWMINLFNFMDGMDGFAGGMLIIGFSAFALLGCIADGVIFSLLSLLIVAAACGFLLSNFPPASIFMGDVGASSMGLLVAFFSIWADLAGYFPLWIACLVFSPFIVDASVTLIKRILGGERFWKAHNYHYYQRMVRAGLGHRKTTMWEYLLMTACAIIAILAAGKQSGAQWAVIVAVCIGYVGLALYVKRYERLYSGRGVDR
jgi:UDP-N-acetylmuramyl pentapeptide phosphotransferase/UDP-N-acetylglucosamine-1-phosphate transferase